MSDGTSSLRGWLKRHSFLLVFTLALVTSVGHLVLGGRLTSPADSYNEQLRVAQYLVRGTGFVCPVGPERQDPSSWYVPGYVGVMAGVLALFGETSHTSLAVIRILNALALSAGLALYFLVARRLLGRAVAGLALLLWVIHPGLPARADQIWDTSWCSFSGAVLLYVFCMWRFERPMTRFLSGLICGAAGLINPVFTLCYPAWVFFAWNRTRSSGANAVAFVRHAALVFLGFMLVILPWTVRNYVTFGELFYLRGNLPLELWVGNAPWAAGDMTSTDGRRVHPVFDAAESARMVRLGEYGYFQACREDVARWWRDNPWRFFRLALRRFGLFWFGPISTGNSFMHQVRLWFPVWAMGILAWIGSVVIVLRHRHAGILVATLAFFPLVYYATLWLPRYRLPIEPLVIIVASVTLKESAGFLRRSRPLRGLAGRIAALKTGAQTERVANAPTR